MISGHPTLIPRLEDVWGVAERLSARMRASLLGHDDLIERVLVALLADGHVLLEDYPGSGKTTLAKAVGDAILDDDHPGALAAFRRMQFTPDLLPSDLTGVMVFDTATSEFSFRRGPVFAYVVLADEINRASPKVQAALLEAMAEKQVTVDDVTHPLDELFFVIATQNPLDSIGTYPLPVAQLDRFLFKLVLKEIARDDELEVLRTWGQPRPPVELPRVTRSEVVAARATLRREVAVAPEIHECLVDVARRLRHDRRTRVGVSTRCLVKAIPALQTLALLRGRDFVSAEDLEALAHPLFVHRLELVPGAPKAGEVVDEALTEPIERLARATLRRR